MIYLIKFYNYYIRFMVWLGANEPEGNELNALKQWVIYLLIGFMIISLYPMYYWLYDLYYQQDIAAIESVYTQFHQGLHNKNYELAYNHMSPEYKSKCSLSEFIWDFEPDGDASNPPLSFNYYLKFSGNYAFLYPGNQWDIRWFGSKYELIKLSDNRWYFTGEYIRYLDFTGYKNLNRTCPD